MDLLETMEARGGCLGEEDEREEERDTLEG